MAAIARGRILQASPKERTMYHHFDYEQTLAASLRGAWNLDDVLRQDQELDFSRNFMPESLARTAALEMLDAREQRLLNQLSANQYLAIFGIVEEFIVPFLLDHARPELRGDDYRVRSLLNFATEEAKHIHMFKRFAAAFTRGFPTKPQLIGPSEAIGAEVLRHDALTVGLVILMIEWMTQQHYLGSIKDNGDIDPLFKRLMRSHWIEEAQHAKLDTLIVDALVESRGDVAWDAVMDAFFEIGGFLDSGLAAQAAFNVDALERLTGKRYAERDAMIKQQHQAARWTYIGSGMVHEKFIATLDAHSPLAARRIAEAAPMFA
ncbi:diiron oxygenase [Aggregicoccus sp. 17bor-14]|uniref:diiron oxygenase n=1 Tax=Myxococcaceae TaxID=31 RepID=UPI00129C6D81|nr:MULTISPECIES: diiron oxygenase [Myxococcaceae]MBF5043297.1 diiron oxygenase [Simulacricoccus sp. 17bor-14]MRI89055.1 diiron oxygenase [Aggregicoccus sp. 17bor-14]